MPSSSRSGSIGQCPIHATEILFVNVFFLFTIINILFLLIKVFFRGAEYASACQHCSKALFLPGTFTRFTRFLHDFTIFYMIFAQFYMIFTRFYAIFAIFTRLFARQKYSAARHLNTPPPDPLQPGIQLFKIFPQNLHIYE